MNEKDFAKVMNVWESENKILRPNKKKLYLEIIDQIASLFSVGNFYYYVLNFENIKMEVVHEGTREVLGINPEQFTINSALELLHPDDLSHLYEKESVATNFLFNEIDPEDILLYKVVYMIRLKHTNGQYKTILHQAKALSITEDGKIQYVLGIHTDVTFLNILYNHHVSFISSQKPSFHATYINGTFNFSENTFKNTFTQREIEIIHQISNGKNFNEIAQYFYVSPHTINTHKKNILNKSGCKNTPELIAKCIREGII
jgi:DNA-binding CsgD family transcriptional regulator